MSEDPGQHQRNAIGLFYGLVYNEQLDEAISKADHMLKFPESPADPVEYIGSLEPLNMTPEEEAQVKREVSDDVEKRGGRWVWENKHRLKLEIRFILDEGGFNG